MFRILVHDHTILYNYTFVLELSKHIKCKEDAIIKGLQKKSNLAENKPSLLPSSLRIGPVLGSKHAEAKSLKTNRRKLTLELKPRVLIKQKAIESKLAFLHV